MRRKANAEKSKRLINTKSVNKNQDKSEKIRGCLKTRKTMFFLTVKLCVYPVNLCETINYTE